jgi:hypothetical protein
MIDCYYQPKENTVPALPKSIVTHPGVQQCFDGPSEGIPDYRYHVWLKSTWAWSNTGYRNYGGSSGNFNTVAEFLEAKPMRRELIV